MRMASADWQATAVPRSHASVAYAAAVTALSFAGVSLYWAAGGTAGLDTLGGSIERDAFSRQPGLVLLLWLAVLFKVAGGALALALVQAWGRRFPRRVLLAAAWGGAGMLTLYGATQTGLVTLMWSGAYDNPSQDFSSSELRWRMLLWEPWFLVWGLLLGLAAWQYGRRTRSS